MLRLPAFLLPFLLCLCLASPVSAQTPPTLGEQIVPNRYVIVYRDGVPLERMQQLTDLVTAQTSVKLGTHSVTHLPRLGLSIITGPEAGLLRARLLTQPEVLSILHDRFVTGHALLLARTQPQLTDDSTTLRAQPVASQRGPQSLSLIPTADADYNSPQGWAIRQAGGFGDNIPGGPPTGPWTTTRGAGVRIAVLDSGLDRNHPDLAPNLSFNLSEVDQDPTTGLPSPCDDGSPQDQSGHGTWAASLAAGALGSGTGQVVGVAPQATLLNIKVLQRMPASTPGDPTTQCEVAQPGGLLSWVLQGLEDAIAQHADVISLSLGTLVDLTTGDGAGWKASFDRVTYAAATAGTVIVAAAGNDGLDLSGTSGNPSHLIELPAQARGVLAVVASTNPACAENLAAGAICAPGPVTRAYYSNYGSTLNALAAPGGSYPEGASTAVSGWIMGACSSGLPNTRDGLPALPGQSFGCFGLGHQAYLQAMGTSASAPLVAGAAALLHAARPDLTAPQIVATLLVSGTTTGSMAEPQLNLPAALALQTPATQPAPPTPGASLTSIVIPQRSGGIRF